MALSSVPAALEAWYLENRPGYLTKPTQIGTDTIANVAIDDYLPGYGGKVVAKSGSTTVTLTLNRPGWENYTVVARSTATVRILRP